jgi:hypothetical protein
MRQPHPLPRARLEKLSTERLLQILKIARSAGFDLWCGEFPSWMVGGSRLKTESLASYEARVAGYEAKWNAEKAQIDAYEKDLKGILATREHVPR